MGERDDWLFDKFFFFIIDTLYNYLENIRPSNLAVFGENELLVRVLGEGVSVS